MPLSKQYLTLVISTMEKCCRNKGVPDECIGDCIRDAPHYEKFETRGLRFMSYCDKWKNIISLCRKEGKCNVSYITQTYYVRKRFKTHL